MNDPKFWLRALLGFIAVVFIHFWIRATRGPDPAPSGGDGPARNALRVAIGAVTNFFDFFGVGSFATTTAMWRPLKLVPDRLIPGTLNVGHTVPTFAQALITIGIVDVDVTTLVSMIAAAVVGAWLGAGVVASWPKRTVQIVMGSALLAAGGVILYRLLNEPPPQGAIGLQGARLAAGVVGNFILGALMTMGIGLYAPCMLLVAMLGMNPETAFPIMMGSCAFLMPVASVQFVRNKGFDRRAALGLAIGGVPAVLLAGLVVKKLDATNLKWLLVAVVLYTSFTLLRAARRERVPATPPVTK